ncbi:hypothetical protein PDIDSM_2071 [Penicillium digitatum]|nr:hypothetical protein PDIDSM_2071 [Penicillium digitatum]
MKNINLSASFAVLATMVPQLALAQHSHTEVTLDATFRTPAPPNDAFAQNSRHVLISTSVMFGIAVIFMFIASLDGKRFKSTVPQAMVLGAAFCVVPEAVDNYLAGCYWSQSHAPNQLLFMLMGREYDYYVGVMWWAFGAILGYLLYAVLLREVKTGTLWICLGLSGLADIVLEEILLGYGGIYMYFGHQPLVLINKFPWWWLFSNVSSLFLSVTIAYRYREWFNGWRSVFILALMPFCYIGAFTLSGMPAIFTAFMMHLILERNPLVFDAIPSQEATLTNSKSVASSIAKSSSHVKGPVVLKV